MYNICHDLHYLMYNICHDLHYIMYNICHDLHYIMYNICHDLHYLMYNICHDLHYIMYNISHELHYIMYNICHDLHYIMYNICHDLHYIMYNVCLGFGGLLLLIPYFILKAVHWVHVLEKSWQSDNHNSASQVFSENFGPNTFQRIQERHALIASFFYEHWLLSLINLSVISVNKAQCLKNIFFYRAAILCRFDILLVGKIFHSGSIKYF
jgi:hypothetical protein